MSMSIASPPEPRGVHPPGAVIRRLSAVLVVLFVLAGTVVLGAAPAHAGSLGTGYYGDSGFLGAYNTDVDGRQGYCIELGCV